MIRQPIKTINTIGRNTQGVRLINLKESSAIASVTKVVKEEETEEETTEERPSPPTEQNEA